MMEGLLRALGFDSKPDYAEKIPEDLKPEDFNVKEVIILLYTSRTRRMHVYDANMGGLS